MPPRRIPFEHQVWQPRKIEGFRLTPNDAKEGVVVEIHKGALNSVLISSLMRFLTKAKHEHVSVEVVTEDDLSFRSLEHCGVQKVAALRKVPATYLHAPDTGADQGAAKPPGAATPDGKSR